MDIVRNNISLRANKRVVVYALGSFITFSFITYLWRFGFSTALFAYGSYLLVYKSKRKGWIFVILSILNHISFLVFTIGLLVQQMGALRLRKWVVVVLCLCSLFLNSSVFTSILPYMPTDIVQRFGSYVDGYYATDYFTDGSWKYQLQIFLTNSITYVAIIIYVLIYRGNNNKIEAITNAILILACLSLPFDTMRMRFLAVLLFFIKMFFLTQYDGRKKSLSYIKVMFFCVMMGNALNIWGARRQIEISDYKLLLYNTMPQIMFHTYTDQWIDKNVTSEGDVVKISY